MQEVQPKELKEKGGQFRAPYCLIGWVTWFLERLSLLERRYLKHLWVDEENCYVGQVSYALPKHASSVKIFLSFNAGAGVWLCGQCMSSENTVPNYCDISAARFSTDSSHSQTISLTVLRQVIGVNKMSPHTVEKLSNLGFLRSQEFSGLGTTVFHVWDRYGECLVCLVLHPG